MSIGMRTSQGTVISHTYGDDISMQPKCVHPIPNISDNRSMRSELFTQMLPTTTLIVEKYILSHIEKSKTKDELDVQQHMYYFTMDELVNVLKTYVDDEIIIYDTLLKCIYPNKLITNWKLLPHLNGIIAIPDKQLQIKNNSNVIKMVRLPSNANANPNKTLPPVKENDEEEDKNESKVNAEVDILINNIIQKIPEKDPNDYIGIYHAYTLIDSLNWRIFARYLVSFNNPSADYIRVCELYAKTGAFIKSSEIPRLSAKHKGRNYIGFVDIFDTTKLDISLIDPLTDTFRDASDVEIKLIKNKRREDLKPKTVDSIYGILEPTHNKKAPAQLFTNQFKLIGTGAKGPISRGAVCEPKPALEIRKYLTTAPLNLNPPEEDNKNILCLKLAIELMKHKLMFIYPEYKP